jgi:replicative DNA helicase
MLDTNMLQSLLNHEFYERHKDRLRAELFAEDFREVFEAIKSAHERYQQDLSPDEVLAVWKLSNPVATRAYTAEVEDCVEAVSKADPLGEEIASDSIQTLWKRHIGKQIATLGLEVSEGNDEAMARLQRLLERSAEGFASDDFGQPTTQDLDELLVDMGDESRFKFHIETLARHVYGIGRTEFGIIFATPETGKTAFVVSLACSPGGYVDQGAKVMMLGNEEATKRTVVRAYSAATGLSKEEIFEDREKAKMLYRARMKDQLIFKDTQEWDFEKIDAYIGHEKPDVVFIDQADKVSIAGRFDASHERLRELYRRLREMAKKHDCAIWGVSQASNDATGKTRITYDMMEGSKIGKAAEADLIIGIGKHSGDNESGEPDNSRFLTISKNKISGWHGTLICTIQPEISRYAE